MYAKIFMSVLYNLTVWRRFFVQLFFPKFKFQFSQIHTQTGMAPHPADQVAREQSRPQSHRERLVLDEDQAEGVLCHQHWGVEAGYHQVVGDKDVGKWLPAVSGDLHAQEDAGGPGEGGVHDPLLVHYCIINFC